MSYTHKMLNGAKVNLTPQEIAAFEAKDAAPVDVPQIMPRGAPAARIDELEHKVELISNTLKL